MDQPRILLVQLFSNGDCLYATAVARQIKKDFEPCHLTWAVSASCSSIIANNPYVDEVIEVQSVQKDDERSFSSFVRTVRRSGNWNHVFVTHIMGRNQANYDGCIRSAIFRGYKYPLDAGIQPVLRLTKSEIANVNSFVEQHKLASFRNVVLFEYSPLSGQSAITMGDSLEIAERLAGPDVAIVLSSARSVTHGEPAIVDGSALTIRETAALSHHCTMLIGCSSGITWSTTSDGGKRLPMIQLLNPYADWINPISRDFKRFGFDDSMLIELYEFGIDEVVRCAQDALVDFRRAKGIYHQQVPLHFRTTRNIVYNLLCYLRFAAIIKHIRINRQTFGDRIAFYQEVLTGFLIFPFRLISNFVRKRILR